MSKKCRHEDEYRTDRAIFSIDPHLITTMRTWNGPRETGSHILTRIAEAECDRCLYCGAWLSLGPANDADERVAVELRAALLAAEWSPDGGVRHLNLTAAEEAGWNSWPHRSPLNHGEEVGFLAAQILNHSGEQAGFEWAGQHNADYAIAAHDDTAEGGA